MTRLTIPSVVAIALTLYCVSSLGAHDNVPWPSSSATISKVRRIFICSVAISPKVVQVNGKAVEFKDAWLETRWDRGPLGLSVFGKQVDGYHLCVTAANQTGTNVTLRLEGVSGATYFLPMMRDVYYYDQISRLDARGYVVECVIGEKERVNLHATPNLTSKVR